MAELLQVLCKSELAVEIQPQAQLGDVRVRQARLDHRHGLGATGGIFGVAQHGVTVLVAGARRGGLVGRAVAYEHEIEFHAGPDAGRRRLALQPRHRLAQELAIQLETDAYDVPALFGAEQVAGAAQLQIAHRDAEAGAELVVLPQGREALPGDVEQVRVPVEQQVRVGLVLETPDAPAQLVKLREPETVRALDDDRVAVRDIEAALDDRGADEHLVRAGHEVRHHALQLVLVHLPVTDADVEVG